MPSLLHQLLSQADIGTPVNITVSTANTNLQPVRDLTPGMYVGTAINLLLGLSGVASFIFLLWGGLQWITAGGDKDGLDKARKRVTQALVGLAIVFSSYTILYILRVLFNVDLIGFTLTTLGN